MDDNLELHRLRLSRQLSTLETRKQQAVCVRHAYKQYGFKINPVSVLEDLNMTVPKGSIYGLLGASGCGKTTLLNCVIGRKRLNSGELWVLGGAPESDESGVPGPRLGYMPQQVSLYGEFTIRETMKYFGWISGLSMTKIEERLQYLVNLLRLPNPNQLVKTLSGGQQRRTSLAVALLHEPELLILDEPTVGLDPLLREIIWDYLLKITASGQTTVILTTHYIDETRQAHLIGLMRGGYILAEESPQNLLNRCNASTLEEAFLKLSVVQNMSRPRRSSIAQDVTNAITIPSGIVNQSAALDDIDSCNTSEISGEFGDNVASSSSHDRISIKSAEDVPLPTVSSNDKSIKEKLAYRFLNFKVSRIKALLWKNFLWLWRNVPILFTIFALPILSVSLFYIAIGQEPTDLPVAVVNYETKNLPCNEDLSCNITHLSCVYLGYLEKRALNMQYYDSESEAEESVLHGRTFASIVIKHNYTAAFKARIAKWQEQDRWNIEYSTIEVFRDVALLDIGLFLKLYLYETLKTLVEDFLATCGTPTDALSMPLKFQEPVYGVSRPAFADFTTPAIILTIAFFMALALTAVSMLTERQEGILERSLVAGVNPIEMLIGHILCDSLLVTGQMITILFFTFVVFKMTFNGSLLLVIILTLLTGFCGMCLGFAVSSGCEDERLAMMIVAGSFLPTLLLSGLIWPVEGMHYILQAISVVLPFTKVTESMRSILQRGWGFTQPLVYQGFISISVWILIFLIISILCLKFKK